MALLQEGKVYRMSRRGGRAPSGVQGVRDDQRGGIRKTLAPLTGRDRPAGSFYTPSTPDGVAGNCFAEWPNCIPPTALVGWRLRLRLESRCELEVSKRKPCGFTSVTAPRGL